MKANSGKLSSTLPLFLTYFQKLSLLFSKCGYFLRKNIVKLRKTCLIWKTRLVAHAQLCGKISRHKCKCIQLNTLTFSRRLRK